MDDVLKLQPQSGLGDLIQLLPTIEAAIGYNNKIIVATNHDYVLKPYGDLVETVPVTIDGIIPRVNHGFKHLRYDRYGSASYRKRYFYDIFPKSDFFNCVDFSRNRFKNWMVGKGNIDLFKNMDRVLFVPPRAAERHKQSLNPLQCAPDCFHSVSRVKKFDLPVILVGNKDLYDPNINDFISYFIDCRDVLSFDSLCCMVMYSKAVVGQACSITTLAGLFGIPTDFLQSRTESTDLHNNHVAAIVWPGQEIIK